MYEARNEAHEFVGESREQAVSKACEFFGSEEGALEIAEVGPGEAYGLGGRCVIVAVPRGAPRPRGGGDGGDYPRGDRDRERGDRGDRGDRGRRGRGEGRGRERGRGRGEGRRERRDTRGEDRAEEEAPAAAVRPEPTAPSVGTPRGELGEIGEFVLGVIERMDLGPFEVSETTDADLLLVEVRGEAAQVLASGEGRAVDALQLLANQTAARVGPERQRVVIDVEGDAEARESFLSSLAQRVARRARSSGRAVALDPMNPRDRRLIHVALRDEDDIATMSVGEGRYRQVVVVPEGAPEYEDARREAGAAAERSTG